MVLTHLEVKNIVMKNAAAIGKRGVSGFCREKMYGEHTGDQRLVNEKLYADDQIHLKKSTIKMIVKYLKKAIMNPKPKK